MDSWNFPCLASPSTTSPASTISLAGTITFGITPSYPTHTFIFTPREQMAFAFHAPPTFLPLLYHLLKIHLLKMQGNVVTATFHPLHTNLQQITTLTPNVNMPPLPPAPPPKPDTANTITSHITHCTPILRVPGARPTALLSLHSLTGPHTLVLKAAALSLHPFLLPGTLLTAETLSPKPWTHTVHHDQPAFGYHLKTPNISLDLTQSRDSPLCVRLEVTSVVKSGVLYICRRTLDDDTDDDTCDTTATVVLMTRYALLDRGLCEGDRVWVSNGHWIGEGESALGCSLTTTILIEYTDAPHPPLDTSPRLLESYTHGSYSQQLDDHCLLKLHGMEFGGVDVGELRGLWNARREGSRRGIWEEWFRNVGGGIDGVFARGEEWGGRSVGMVWKNILGVLPAVVRDGARPNNMPYTRTRIAFDVVDECEIVGAVLSFGDAGWEVRWQGLSVTVVGNVKGTHEHAVRRAGHTVGVVKVERVFGVAEWVGNLNDGVEGLNECGATRDAGGGQVVVCGAAVWVVWAVAVVMGGGEDCAHLLEGGREVMDVEDGAVVVAPVEERRAGRAANDEVVPLQTEVIEMVDEENDAVFFELFEKLGDAMVSSLVTSFEVEEDDDMSQINDEGELACESIQVFVGGVARVVTQAAMKAHLSLFCKHGEVGQIVSGKGGHMKVMFEDGRDAWRVMRFQEKGRRDAKMQSERNLAAIEKGRVSAPPMAGSSTVNAVPPGSPGSWICNKCCQNNFKTQTYKCYKCPQLKVDNDDDFQKGQWVCFQCSNDNFPSRSKCNAPSCEVTQFENWVEGRKKVVVRQSVPFVPKDWACECGVMNGKADLQCECGRGQEEVWRLALPSADPAATANTTDAFVFVKRKWTCFTCSNLNFASRATCTQYGCDMTAEDSQKAELTGSGPALAFVRRDWTCVTCSNFNFASRATCTAPTCDATAVDSQKAELGLEGAPAAFAFKPRDWTCVECGHVNWRDKESCYSSNCTMTAYDSAKADFERQGEKTDVHEDAYFTSSDDLLPAVHQLSVEFKFVDDGQQEATSDRAKMMPDSVPAPGAVAADSQASDSLFTFTAAMLKRMARFARMAGDPSTAGILAGGAFDGRRGAIVLTAGGDPNPSHKCLWATDLENRARTHAFMSAADRPERVRSRPAHLPKPLLVADWDWGGEGDLTTVYSLPGGVRDIARLRCRVKCGNCDEFLRGQKQRKRKAGDDGEYYVGDPDPNSFFKRPQPDKEHGCLYTMPLRELGELVNTSERFKKQTLRDERDRAFKTTIVKCQHLACLNKCPKRFATLAWDARVVLSDGRGRLVSEGEGNVVKMALGLGEALVDEVEEAAWLDPRGVEYNCTVPLTKTIVDNIKMGMEHELTANEIATYKLHVACKDDFAMWDVDRLFYVRRDGFTCAEKGAVTVQVPGSEGWGVDKRSEQVVTVQDARVKLVDVQEIDADAEVQAALGALGGLVGAVGL